MNQAPVHRQIVLAGGGYAHLLFIRMWCMQPLPGVRVTLVSPLAELPYSGMLPGLLAGEYTAQECHIDLVRLCQRAGVRLLLDEVRGLDRDRKRVQLALRPPLDYDLVSINTGPQADTRVPGVREHALPLKPVARFLPHWHGVLERLRSSERSLHLVMTGGGAGSVESLLGMARCVAADSRIVHKPQFTLLTASDRLLPGYAASVGKAALEQCHKAGIRVLCGKRVSRVEEYHLYTEDSFNAVLPYDALFWCGEAGAAAWPAASGLACDTEGFIHVDAHLRSVNDTSVFAAGDAAAFAEAPLPKAGVYAVRQAPVLFHNLRAALLGQGLRRYRPQARFLSLLHLDTRLAAGSYGPLALSGTWLRAWKARIDRRFIASLQRLYEAGVGMPEPASTAVHPALVAEPVDPARRCAGCGGKLGADNLAAVLTEVLGHHLPEDASLLAFPSASVLQSVDLLRSPIDDPWLFGRIAALHALNDLFAMGAQPHSLQVALTLPYAAAGIHRAELRLVLEGIFAVCREQGVRLAGGHSAEGSDFLLALTVNGIPGKQPLHKRGLRPGDLLVTNAVLGSGMALAAHMQHCCPAPLLEAALQQMNRSQGKAAAQLAALGASACTDITGFGLLGHLVEMLTGSGLHASLRTAAIPLLPGVAGLAEAGIRSSLFEQNRTAVLRSGLFDDLQEDPLWPLLLDPQTAGGLLAGITSERREAAEAAGFVVIGTLR